MSHQKADLAVFIGRFQPFHIGHEYAIRRALELAKQVLILIGDTGGPRTIKNPWTFEQRRHMIRRSFPEQTNSQRRATSFEDRILIDRVYDFPYTEHEWIAQVQEIVGDIAGERSAKNIVMVGHDKDSSSYYLKLFPQWKFIDTGYEEIDNGIIRKIDATEIRNMIFEDKLQYATGVLNNAVIEILANDRQANRVFYDELKQEYDFIRQYRASWASAPFPPVFVTTDAIVVQSGHILLVKRGQNPGKGLWAIPGGFIDQAEGIDECAIRELLEETSIKLQPEVLRRCIRHVQVFDRRGGVSQEDRGRIITHAHLFKLDDTKELPKVKGADDAAEAKWIPLGELNNREIFSDHSQIIHAMLGKLS